MLSAAWDVLATKECSNISHVLLEPAGSVWVRAAQTRGDAYFPDELREQLPAFRILRTLAVLDISPLAVTGHQSPVRGVP